MSISPRRALFALGFLAFAVLANAGEGADRPRIGLALSGGGARGCAHVGVLKVLEELRVPVDVIAGTSMGAVVGGVYASGVASTDLESLIAQIDWDAALDDHPQRQDLDFRRKQEDSRYLLDLELGLSRKGFLAPSGLRSGQKLKLLLRNLTLPFSGDGTFDALPIPFRAVATDIETGSMFVLDHGDLATAIRASMAIPGMFTAVEMHGRLLSDGGMSRNLPIDVARAMGAEVVIAIDITEPLRDRGEGLDNLFGLSGQILSFISRVNVEEVLDQADLVIAPNVDGVGMLDFSGIPDIVARGERAARAMADELRAYAVDPVEYGAYRERFRDPGVPAREIAYVRLAGLKRLDERPLRRRLELRPGEPLDLAKLARDINRIYGLGDFESIDFQLVNESDGRVGVVLKCREKSWGPNYLHFGFNLSIDENQDTVFNGLANLTAIPLNARRGEWRTDLQLGRTLRAASEIYQPLDWSGNLFAAVQARWERNRFDVFREERNVAEIQSTSALFGLDLGVQFGVFGELRAGPRWGSVRAEFEVGDPNSPVFTPEDQALLDEPADLAGYEIRFTLDRLDSVSFPQKGGALTLQAWFARPSLGADVDYDRVELTSLTAASHGRHHFFLQLDAGSDFDTGLPPYDRFALGGFLNFSGYQPGELSGNNYARGGLGYYLSLGKSSLFRKLYVGGWLEAGNVWDRVDDISANDLRYAGSLAFGMDTVLGPVFIAWGAAESGRSTLYLSVGTAF